MSTESKTPDYQPVENLKQIFQQHCGEKFLLDCGHRVTLGHNLGNNIIILNGPSVRVICTLCGY
ncbi:MAG: hypothetical protein PHI97_29840 [Desulfobulbus sp.]|nr:hypothetical protein [Desulfobulbus sp.]